MLIMLRLLFVSIFIASLCLNIYFFVQLKAFNLVEEAMGYLQEEVPTTLSTNKTSNNDSFDSSRSTEKATKNANFNNNQQTNVVDEIKQNIQAKQFFEAANLLYELPQEDTNQLSTVKSYWLNDSQQLLNTKQYQLVAESLDAYLAYSPDDLDFLFLFVELHIAKQQILMAIKSAFDLQYHTQDFNLQNQSNEYANQLVRQEISRLLQNGLWFELANFSSEVLVITPQSSEALWALAQAQFHQGEYQLARESVDSLLIEPNYQVKAHELVKLIEMALQQPAMIPLVRQGVHFVVEGVINNHDKVNLLIDTGASISVLSQEFFDNLASTRQLNYISDIVLMTAGGEISSSIYQVEHFELHGYRVDNFKFAVNPYMTSNNDGLLGMNFLRLFDFHIDQTNSLLSLSNKP